METIVVSHFWGRGGSGVGRFSKVAETSKFCHVSTSATFAVTERTHLLRCRPSQLNSPLDGVENGRNPAGFVASSRNPGLVRSSARSVVSRTLGLF